ncbi:MAG: hypothetical protein IKP91_00420 [Bacteroidaceae bacterium]|nr:hypothetical protein [Bacteroidaceae bacterium]
MQGTFKTHPLLSTCYKVFTPRGARLDKGFLVTPFDVFIESARLLDFLLCTPEISQHRVDSLWNMMFIDIMKWGTNVTDHNKRMVAGTVFQVVRATLAQYYDGYYSETVCGLLNHTLEREMEGCDENEQTQFLQRLVEQSPGLCEWINGYEEAGEWLSDQIADTLDDKGGKGVEEDFRPSGRTLTKTALLTDKLIDIIGQRLTQANKLDASPDDFRKLFSGTYQQFTMTWSGTGGELRDLFKMLTDQHRYAKPHRGYQQILKSHFLDRDGRRFLNIHGDKSIPSFQPVIDDCAFLLQHLTDNMTAIMKQLISENESVLREMGYFDNLQAAKQSGLSIRNKRR